MARDIDEFLRQSRSFYHASSISTPPMLPLFLRSGWPAMTLYRAFLPPLASLLVHYLLAT